MDKEPTKLTQITNDKIDLIESEYPQNMWVKMGTKAQLAHDKETVDALIKEERRAMVKAFLARTDSEVCPLEYVIKGIITCPEGKTCEECWLEALLQGKSIKEGE